MISIETLALEDGAARRASRAIGYPNEIGPGVYDIHSPRVPTHGGDARAAAKGRATVCRREQLWVNPDCGLKTRGWEEVRPALVNMVAAARQMRANLAEAAE